MKVEIDYADEKGETTQRVIWPFLLAYSEDVSMICAWCELRNDFRNFRTDRVRSAELTDDRIPERISTLRYRWQKLREAENAAYKAGNCHTQSA